MLYQVRYAKSGLKDAMPDDFDVLEGHQRFHIYPKQYIAC